MNASDGGIFSSIDEGLQPRRIFTEVNINRMDEIKEERLSSEEDAIEELQVPDDDESDEDNSIRQLRDSSLSKNYSYQLMNSNIRLEI